METELRRLRFLGRIVAVAFGVFFGVGIVGHLTGHSVEAHSTFGSLVRWGEGGEPQEVMLGSVYLAIAAYLWIASGRPFQHWLHLDFALAANAAHSLVMILLSVLWPHSMQHLWGDSLLTVIPTALLAYAWLPLRSRVVAAARSALTSKAALRAGSGS
jgi:hypothetical protein